MLGDDGLLGVGAELAREPGADPSEHVRHLSPVLGVLVDAAHGAPGARVVAGPVASGNKVVDDLEAAAFASVLELDTKLVAIEMEGAGETMAVSDGSTTTIWCSSRWCAGSPTSR